MYKSGIQNGISPSKLAWRTASVCMYLCFVFIAAAMMSAIYEENKDEDGFLYMTYSGENTFGTFLSVVQQNFM